MTDGLGPKIQFVVVALLALILYTSRILYGLNTWRMKLCNLYHPATVAGIAETTPVRYKILRSCLVSLILVSHLGASVLFICSGLEYAELR